MPKTSKIKQLWIKREPGFLYFIDKDGDVSRAFQRYSGKKGVWQKVAKVGIKREKGYMYFLDKEGDIAATKLSRKGPEKKLKSERAKPLVKYLLYSQLVNGAKHLRAQRVLFAEKARDFSFTSPTNRTDKRGKQIYGILIKYEQKVRGRFKKTKKFIRLAKPGSNLKLVNKLPKKYC